MPKPLSILLALLLLTLGAAAAAFGIAEIYRGEAVRFLAEWESQDEDDEEEGLPAWAWEQMHRYLWLANRLAPWDARILEDLGEHYELRADEALTLTPEVSADLDRALGFYRQALALRPAWSDAWVNIALVKLSQEHIDAEFAFAMERALDLGRWDTLVQASIASAGLATWDELPAQLQMRVEDSIARGLKNGSRFMSAVAIQYRPITADE